MRMAIVVTKRNRFISEQIRLFNEARHNDAAPPTEHLQQSKQEFG